MASWVSEKIESVKNGEPPVNQDLVLEDPLVPDVHAGVTVRRPGQIGAEMKGERPGEGECRRDVTGQNGEV